MILFSGLAIADTGATPTTISNAFARPLSLRGTLGNASIQANLRAKAEFPEGVEGEYVYFGRQQNILLAGEFVGGDLLMEESENGSDVTGYWTGTLAGDRFSGEWESADGKVKRPFDLRIVSGNVGQRTAPTPDAARASNDR